MGVCFPIIKSLQKYHFITNSFHYIFHIQLLTYPYSNTYNYLYSNTNIKKLFSKIVIFNTLIYYTYNFLSPLIIFSFFFLFFLFIPSLSHINFIYIYIFYKYIHFGLSSSIYMGIRERRIVKEEWMVRCAHA